MLRRRPRPLPPSLPAALAGVCVVTCALVVLPGRLPDGLLPAAGATRREKAADGRAAWTYETLGAIWAAPLVLDDGRVCAASEDGTLTCLEAGGRMGWYYKAERGLSGWPTLVDRRTLAVAGRNNTLYLFGTGGDLLGKVGVGGEPSGPLAVHRGQVHLGTLAGHVVAVVAGERRLRWSFPVGAPKLQASGPQVPRASTQSKGSGGVTGWPVVDGAGRVFAGAGDGVVVALDSAGALLWRRTIGGLAVAGGIALVGPRRGAATGLVAAALSGEVVGLDAQGRSRWTAREQVAAGGIVTLDERGAVVYGTADGAVVARDVAGRELWRFAVDAAVQSRPTVAGDRVYVGSDAGSLFVLDGRSGRPLGLFPVGSPIRGGISVAGGRVLFGAQDRRLYVVPDPAASAVAAGRWSAASALKARLQRAPTATLLWRQDLSGPVASGVVAGADGDLLAATWGKKVFVLGPRGEVRWTYSCGEDIDTAPAVAAGGDVLFGCGDGGLYGLKPNGDLRFRHPVNKPLSSSPAVAGDGTIYFGAGDKRVWALTREGKILWRILTGGDVDSAPRIAADGMIYVGSDDRHLYALSPLGHVSWYFRTAGPVRSRPALARDGTIYITSLDQSVYAVSGNGSAQWSYQTGGQLLSAPLAAADGTVYFGSRDHGVYALRPDGTLRWRFVTAGEVDGEPTLAADGSVVVGSDDGNLYALAPADGALRWWHAAGAEIRGRIVTRADGAVVFGTMDGAAIAVAPPDSAAAHAMPTTAPSPLVVWRARVGRGRAGPPLALPDGGVAVAGADGVLRAVGTDRFPRWSARVGEGPLAPPLASGDDLFVADARGNLAAVRGGQLRFRLRLERAALTAPALLVTGEGPLVLVGGAAGRLWAVTPEGKVRWFWSGAAAIRETPVVLGAAAPRVGSGHMATPHAGGASGASAASSMVVVLAGSELVGVDATGQRAWAHPLPAPVAVGPVALQRLAVVADGRGELRAVGADGRLRWQRDVGAAVAELLPLDRGAALAVRTIDGRVLELAADGEPLLAVAAPTPLAALTAAGDGALCLVDRDGVARWLDRATGLARRAVDLTAAPIAAAAHGRQAVVLVTNEGELVVAAARPATPPTP